MTTISVASWNVNSIRARLNLLLEWMKSNKPDIILLQELKAINEAVPKEGLEDLNYNLALKGQKGYNGVAILSKYPISDIQYNLPNFQDDPQSRYIEAWIDIKGKGIRVASIYAPNGNPILSEKYGYKIKWLNAFKEYSKKILKNEEIIILGGDYNICPAKIDVAREELITKDAIYQEEVKNIYKEILNAGYFDAFRSFYEDKIEFTYWDYGQAFSNNLGVRIDHFLLSSLALDKCQSIVIDKNPRSSERPSDHTPIIASFAINKK